MAVTDRVCDGICFRKVQAFTANMKSLLKMAVTQGVPEYVVGKALGLCQKCQ